MCLFDGIKIFIKKIKYKQMSFDIFTVIILKNIIELVIVFGD